MSIEHKVTCGCTVTPCCFYLSKKPLQWKKLNNLPSVHSCRWRGHWNDPGKTPPPYLEFSVSSVELHLHLFLMFTFFVMIIIILKNPGEKSQVSLLYWPLYFTDFTDLFTDPLLLYWPLLSMSPSWNPVFSVLLKSLKHWSYALEAWIIQMDVQAD